MPRVLIADDHTVLRHGLRLILNQADGLTVVGEAADGEEAIALALELQPDVILMDLNMPELNGLEATRQILQENPEDGANFLQLFLRQGGHEVGSLTLAITSQ